MLLVTFDSNVYRPVADPSRFPKDPMHAALSQINAAIRAGRIQGRLCETIFTLEAIPKIGRRAFLANYRMKIEHEEVVQPNGMIQIKMKMGPDTGAHPGNNPYLDSHLTDALGIGFRLMRCPRIAGVVNPDLKEEWFASNPKDWNEKFGEVGRKIESCGAGLAVLKEIGKKFAAPGENWIKGLAKAPSTEDELIASAVAEWADGDTIAAHVAYENHYFCTRDLAKAAGSDSVFSSANRSWIEKDYGVQFVTPDELIEHI
jgi:hypothetical protein